MRDSTHGLEKGEHKWTDDVLNTLSLKHPTGRRLERRVDRHTDIQLITQVFFDTATGRGRDEWLTVPSPHAHFLDCHHCRTCR